MKYKNTSERLLRFRAHNTKGIIEVFELKPGEEMESDRLVEFGGLEQISGKGKSEEPLLDHEEEMKGKLMEMKMGVLREFGKDYDARDTSKEELIDEIIEKAPPDDIKKFMEGGE